jgi:hypothetical protein
MSKERKVKKIKRETDRRIKEIPAPESPVYPTENKPEKQTMNKILGTIVNGNEIFNIIANENFETPNSISCPSCKQMTNKWCRISVQVIDVEEKIGTFKSILICALCWSSLIERIKETLFKEVNNG